MYSKYMPEYPRAIERLKGILAGISIDCEIQTMEVAKLWEWINIHEYMHHLEPFKGCVALLKRCLEDGVIDEDEKEEILCFCDSFLDLDHWPSCVTNAIRRLHGVLHGISIDGCVRENEIRGLKDWLLDYDAFKDVFPFNDVWLMVTAILADGVVTEDEKTSFLEFCRYFSEILFENPIVHDCPRPFGSPSRILTPFTALCERDIEIHFEDNRFCFTGPARTGTRRQLEALLMDLSGIPQKNVTMNLNYLVIGAQSSPCWAFSTYGRKIEKVLEYQEKEIDIAILHEDDFVKQAYEAKTLT